MQSFFSKVSDYLYQNYNENISDLCLVLPNRRAGLFLKTAIAKRFNRTIWAPEIFSTEDFIGRLSGLEVIDSTTLLFRFYKVYKKVEGDNAQPFEEFVKWGQILLSDFNEIDSYYINTNKLFEYINENRALEVWNLSGEELTDVQKNYLKFWKSLGNYYENLKADLLESNNAYQGMAYRLVADNVLEKIQLYEHTHKPLQKIIFIGFNALNDAEEKIFKTLIAERNAEILWDADNYYFENRIQEAGKFLRKHKEKTGLFSLAQSKVWLEDMLGTDSKNIEITGVASNVGQAKLASEILQSIEAGNNFQDTALVLADENLLIPVLNSIPPSVDGFNITMGYPLKNSPVYDFIESLFRMHENAKAYGKSSKDYRFHHEDVLGVLSNRFCRFLEVSGSSVSFVNELEVFIVSNNKIFISSKEIDEFISDKGFSVKGSLRFVFSKWETIDEVVSGIVGLIDSLAEAVKGDEAESKVYTLEFLFNYSKAYKQVHSFVETYNEINDLKTLRFICNQIVGAKMLAFYGEPLKGLQVMGMLETRNLDFETIVLLSANENILPAGKTANSFIPHEVKRAFNLPTYTEKDAIFAYHFYRLIQRAKNIYLIYNTEQDEFGSGEKSRFITQLIAELPKANQNVVMKEYIYSLSSSKIDVEKIIIRKDAEILNKLDSLSQSGISPSAINTYIQCPLNFYYKYILGLREEKEIEETIESSTLGTFIHEVLENLYKEFICKKISSGDIKEMKEKVFDLTNQAFLKKYNNREIQVGKNKLVFTIAVKYIQNFLDKEYRFLLQMEKENIPVLIRALEKELTHKHCFVINGKETEITLKGKADRIDEVGSEIRIIDYKTGNVEVRDTQIKDMAEITTAQKSKCLQLLMYAWLFEKENKLVEKKGKLKTGIISLRKPGAGLIPFNINKDDVVSENALADFEVEIQKVIQEIYSAEMPFTHHKDARYCEFCNP